jgi:hypothetical protein
VTRTEHRWRGTLLMPAAALAVHQLRYFITYGAAAHRELQEQGHSYMHSLAPWIVLAVGLCLGRLVSQLWAAWRIGEADGAGQESLSRAWIGAALALVMIYFTQELLEGFFASGHPAGMGGILGNGGWWALPSAVLVGLGWALLVRGARVAITIAAARGRRAARRFRTAHLLPRPCEAPAIPRSSPLASCVAGRAPPALA